MNFMNLPSENAKFLLLQVPFEHGLTYGTGTKNGPAEIVKASEHVEHYDEQFNTEPQPISCPEPVQYPETPDETVEVIAKQITNQFPIVLGGDHSISLGVVQGLEQHHNDFGVLIFDAHSDCRYKWNGSTKNHACVTRNIAQTHKVGIVGVRSQDKDEDVTNVSIIHAYNHSEYRFKELLQKLPEKLYISIDVDVFDPSFIRNTGTPEPGGFFWNDMIQMLQTTFEEKAVIGTDIVEFAPTENYRAEAFSLAKLVFKIMVLASVQQQNHSLHQPR